MKAERITLSLAVCAGVLALGTASWAPPLDKVTRVTLTRRADNGPYEKSAYSFRYASRDVGDHMNAVDLIFNGCGNLHISEGGATHRVAKSSETKLSKLTTIPEHGWSTGCFVPEESAVYAMEVKDEFQRFYVKFRVTESKQSRVSFEWQPFTIQPSTELATLGQCAGPHECQ